MEWLKFRASQCSALFLGDDGLTDKQQDELNTLINKDKRTPLQDIKMNELMLKRDSDPELSKGAKSYIESVVDEYVYQYRDSIDNKYTKKGTDVEDKSIEILNTFFFTDYKKSETYLQKGHFHGHPDVEDEDEKMILDAKSSWNKKTFPKKPVDCEKAEYEWQGKLYCYMKGWSKFRLAYVLVSTPEGLVPEYEDESLHYVDNLSLNLRITYVDYILSDEDIKKIERREKAAVKYAEEYYNFLINKNK
jgi:hypothetical protein